MIALFVAALMWQEATPGPYIDGLATFYAPGVMEQVAANRGMDLGSYAGGVALNRAGDLNRDVWIEYEGRIHGPYRMVDCARRGHDYQKREREGYVIEVSFQQGRAWHMAGPVNVRVWFVEPHPEPARAM